jgi:dTDP-4-dehydrorhamnose reductase
VRLLLTGAGGQVAHEVARRCTFRGFELECLARAELDISDPDAVRTAVAKLRPDVVINAAAYTAVDRAESEPGLAYAVNAEGPGHLASACSEFQAVMIHLSTDFVFDGRAEQPYLESDPIGPAGVYARSKALGEERVRVALAEHLILRVSWIFGAHGHNFVKTMLRLASERKELRVVSDQHGCPTWSGDIANAILVLAEKLGREGLGPWGTYHFCDEPATSWHGFAVTTVAEARRRTSLRTERILPITTADYPLPAPRPAWSVLDCRCLARTFGIEQPDWRVGLAHTLDEILGPTAELHAAGDGAPS